MQTPDSTVSRRVVVVSPNPNLVAEVSPHLAAQWPQVPITHLASYPSPRDLNAAVSSSPGQLVLLDVVTDPDRALALISEITRLNSNLQVLALLSGNDPDVIMRCLRSGAADLLMQPFTADQVAEVLGKLANQQPGSAESAPPRESTKFIVVMPAKGACGATTIACNLAFYWKKLGARRILLADLDPLTGTLSFLLKIKSVYSFLDAIQRTGELDEDLWNSMITEVNGVDVLLAPELMSENPTDLTDPLGILDFARTLYDVVIIDAASVYGEWNLAQARIATELLLVTTNELPALQAAQRALSYLDANRIGRWKVRLIVNRYQRDVGLNKDVIGTALHSEVFDSLPSDYEAVQRSLMEGKPVPSNTALGKGLKELAERLAGPDEKSHPKKTDKKSTGGLFGLFSKTSK